ncbi:hypothetical protein ABT379_31770, partial [Streptomyces goshikiensis]
MGGPENDGAEDRAGPDGEPDGDGAREGGAGERDGSPDGEEDTEGPGGVRLPPGVGDGDGDAPGVGVPDPGVGPGVLISGGAAGGSGRAGPDPGARTTYPITVAAAASPAATGSTKRRVPYAR